MSKALTFEAEPFELAYEVTRQSGTLNCGQVATPPCSSECIALSQSELRKFKLKPVKKSSPEGKFIDRTEGNRTINKALQLIDYDVNEWRPCKPQHREALNQLTEFINSRLDNSNQPVAVTATGSATRTDTKEYNDRLSCMRANCVTEIIKLGIHPARLRRVSINPSGEGFSRAPLDVPGQAEKRKEFRSVLVQVHAPDNPPPPIPVIPGWNQYKIRCCSYKSQTVLEWGLDQILNGILPNDLFQRLESQLPQLRGVGGIVRKLATEVLKKVKKFIEEALKKALAKQLPRVAGLLNKLEGVLKFIIVNIVVVKAVFQIMERNKPNAKELILCYGGVGVRAKRPDIPKLDKAIDDLLDAAKIPNPLRGVIKNTIKSQLEKLLKGISGIHELKSNCAQKEFREFDIVKLVGSSNKPVPVNIDINKFKGDASLHTGLNIRGRVNLFFNTPTLNTPGIGTRISCRAGCFRNGIELQVGDGKGIELALVSEGKLSPGDNCRCTECTTVLQGIRESAQLARRPTFEFEMEHFVF